MAREHSMLSESLYVSVTGKMGPDQQKHILRVVFRILWLSNMWNIKFESFWHKYLMILKGYGLLNQTGMNSLILCKMTSLTLFVVVSTQFCTKVDHSEYQFSFSVSFWKPIFKIWNRNHTMLRISMKLYNNIFPKYHQAM